MNDTGMRDHRSRGASAPRPRLGGLNLHVYPSKFTHESRMLRITGSLAEAGVFDDIHIVVMAGQGLPDRERLDETRLVWRVRPWLRERLPGVLGKLFGQPEWMVRIFLRYLREDVACVNPHSLYCLPVAVAFKLVKGSRIVYDTHELEPETQGASPLRRRFARLGERLLMQFVDETAVTSDGYADWYRRTYGLERVWVVKNFPYRRRSARSSASILREKAGVPADAMLFIYQGLVAKDRGVEMILEAFAELGPDKHVVFMGDGPLVPTVERYAAAHPNIHRIPPVGPTEVVSHVMGADVGFCVIEHACLSYYHTLPNKALEGLAAGIPVIVSNFPDMAALVNEAGAGWTVEPECNALKALLRSITREDIAARAKRAASWTEEHCWEALEPRLFQMYASLSER